MKYAIIALFCISGVLAIPANKNSGRIIGGEIAEEGQFPYIVSITVKGQHYCGGVILNNKTIITAAHCLYGINSFDIHVRVGSNKLNGNDVATHYITMYNIHSDYDPYLYSNDIALIGLDVPITFDEKAQPVTLPTSNIGEYDDVVLSGWGQTDNSGDLSNDLKFIHMKTIDYVTCDELNSLPITYDQVCTMAEWGTGPCFGDSGSPLVDSNGTYVGLLSFGTPCAIGHPDVFTKIYSHLVWIEANKVE